MVLEYEILIERTENTFLTELSLIYLEDFSVSSLIEKGKAILHKIVEAFKTFVRNLGTTVKTFVAKKQMQFRLMQIKRLLKKVPSFRYQKVDVYLDPSAGKRRDRQMLEMRNLMTKIRLKRKDPRLYSIMEDIHKDIMLAYPRQTMTIEKAVDLMEEEVERFDNDLSQSVYNLVHMVDVTEDIADDPEIQQAVSTIATDLQEDDSKRAKSLIRNMQHVFVSLRTKVSDAILYGKRYIATIKAFNRYEDMRALKNLKPVRWFETDGLRIPVYGAWQDYEPNSGTPALTFAYSHPSVLNEETYPIIVCYQDFFKFDVEMQDAILLHEIGHIAHGHLVGKKLRDYAADLKELKRQQKMAQRYMDDHPGGEYWGSHGSSVKDIDNEVWRYLFQEIEADKYSIANGGNIDSLNKLLMSVDDGNNVQDMRAHMR